MILKGCYRGVIHGGEEGSLTLILIREADFRTIIGEINFQILFITKEVDTQFLMSLEFFLSVGVLMQSHLYFFNQVDKLFDMEYIFLEDYVKFKAYKLKGRAAMVELIAKYSYALRQTTYKNVEKDKKTFTSTQSCFGRRRNRDSTPTCHEFLLIEQDSGATTANPN